LDIRLFALEEISADDAAISEEAAYRAENCEKESKPNGRRPYESVEFRHEGRPDQWLRDAGIVC